MHKISEENSIFYNVEKPSKHMVMVTLIVACILAALSVFDPFLGSEHALRVGAGIGISTVLLELSYMKYTHRRIMRIFRESEGNTLFELCRNQINQ